MPCPAARSGASRNFRAEVGRERGRPERLCSVTCFRTRRIIAGKSACWRINWAIACPSKRGPESGGGTSSGRRWASLLAYAKLCAGCNERAGRNKRKRWHRRRVHRTYAENDWTKKEERYSTGRKPALGKLQHATWSE